LGLLAGGANAAKKGKPDLVVKDADLRGKEWAIIDEPRVDGRIRYKVTNKGNRSAMAGVATRLYFLGGGNRYEGELDVLAKKLKPGESESGTITLEDLNKLPAGAYKLRICVDYPDFVKEQNERNNCEKVKGARYYSTYRYWRGTLDSTGPIPGLNLTAGPTETGSSQDALLGFGNYLGRGAFDWNVQNGTVVFALPGTDGMGCVWSGGGSIDLARQKALTVDYQDSTYSLFAEAISEAQYVTTGRCSFGGFPYTFNSTGPTYSAIVEEREPQPLSGTERIAGNGGVGDQKTSWNLAGE